VKLLLCGARRTGISGQVSMGFGRAPIPGCCEVGGCIVDGSSSSCAILRHVNVRVVNDVAIAASDDATAAGTLGTRQLFRAK